MPQVSTKRTFCLIFVVAFLLRLVVVLLHPVTDLPDSRDYNTLAMEILHHQPYQVTDIWGQSVIASRMPGYPVFIAFIYKVTGERPIAVLIVQAFLGAGCVPIVYLIARRISIRIGLIAAALTALDPLGILFSATLLSEVPFTFLLLMVLWQVLEITAKQPRLRDLWAEAIGRRSHAQTVASTASLYSPPSCAWLLSAGIAANLSGLAIFQRGSALWLMLILPLVVLIRRPIRAIIAFALMLAFVLLTLLIWQASHAALNMGLWHLTSLEGISLYEAVYPSATGGPMQDKIALPPEMVPFNEAQRDAEWNRRAWQYIHDDPARIIHLAFIKFGRTWSPWLNASEYQIPVLNVLLTLWHVPIYILAIIGMFRPKIPSILRWVMLLPIIYFSLVHSLFLGSVRYRVPLMPLLYVFAAIPLASLLGKYFIARKSANSPSSA